MIPPPKRFSGVHTQPPTPPPPLAQGLDATNPVTTKILRLHLTQKLNNYRGSDVRGDGQFELSSQND